MAVGSVCSVDHVGSMFQVLFLRKNGRHEESMELDFPLALTPVRLYC